MQQALPTASAATKGATMGRAPRGKLLYKLLVVFLFLSVGPLILAGFQLIRISDDFIQKESRGVRLAIAQKVASNVASYMTENVKNILQVVHKSSDFLAMNPRRQTEILGNVMNAYPMFMRMAVLDLSGREISVVNRMGGSSPKAAHQENREALRSIRSLGDYIGPLSRSAEGYPEITIGVPMERIPGLPIGVLLGVVNLIDLSSLVKDLKIGAKGYVYIVDMEKQQLVAHPQAQTEEAKTLFGNPPPPEVVAASFVPAESKSGAIEFTDETKHKFLATYATVGSDQERKQDRLLEKINWRVFVQQPIEEAYQASSQMRYGITKVLIGVIVITLFLTGFISHQIVKRVKTLQQAMGQVGEGNFDIPAVPRSNDEFGSLTDKFIWMARSLKDKTLRLVSAQQELQRWNTELERRVQERTRALQEAQDQLIAQEKLAALGQMASVVGHELRNPLAVMNNSIYFLKTKLLAAAGEAGLDAKLDKHLHILEGEIVKSNTIIRDILDFARNRALNAAPHKIDELVEKAIERIQIPSTVTLQKNLGLNGTEAMVDEDELRQVLTNLMENACQAMTSGGTLMVGTKAQGEFVEITIVDTGCGIPQEHLAKIFAPFFTTKSRGTGLGLAVVKKIVDRHHGFIEVASKVGEGTAFHLRLPLGGGGG